MHSPLLPHRPVASSARQWLRLVPALLVAGSASLALAQAPLQLHEGFEQTAVGARPAEISISDGGVSAAVRVADDMPKAGKHYLRISDGPEEQPKWTPYFYFTPHHTKGTSRISCDIQLDQTSFMLLQLRDGEAPGYKTAVNLHFNQGVLFDNGAAKLMDYPVDTWLHVEITLKTGPTADGTFNLTVSAANGKSQHFDKLKTVDAGVKELNWFGFINPNEDVCSWSLDEVDIRSNP